MARSSALQGWQFKKEATPGTLLAASNKALGMGLEVGPELDIALNRPLGFLVPAGTQLVSEKTAADWSGLADYNALTLPFNSLFGAVTPTQPDVTNAPTAYQRVWSYTGKSVITPLTYSIEVGDSNRAVKFPYGVFTSLNLAISRTGENTMDGELMGQALQLGATMTAAPTEIPMKAVAGTHWKAYYASTFAGLSAGTVFAALYEAGIGFSDVYAEEWTVNRDVTGFKSLVPAAEPSYEWTMTLGADAVAEGYLTQARSSGIGYIRLEAVGDAIGTTPPSTTTYKLTIDMALSVTDLDKFGDKDGLYAMPITTHLTYDATAAKAMQITLVNTVADTAL